MSIEGREIQALEERIDELESDITGYKEEVADLEDNNGTLEDEIANLLFELDSLHDRYETEVGEWEADAAVIRERAEVAENYANLSAATSRYYKLSWETARDECAELKGVVDDLDERVEKAEQKFRDYKIVHPENEEGALSAAYDALVERLGRVESQASENLSRAFNAEAEANELWEENNSLRMYSVSIEHAEDTRPEADAASERAASWWGSAKFFCRARNFWHAQDVQHRTEINELKRALRTLST